MMTLNTSILRFDESAEEVYVKWFIGLENNGVFKVNVRDLGPNAKIIAELMVMRHVVFTIQGFGLTPRDGRSYRFNVSTGAIKKLAQGRSTKEDCFEYAGFLRGRLEGCSIVVGGDDFPDDVVDLEAALPCPSTFDRRDFNVRLDTPAMGTVYVTRHAVDQYAKRISEGSPKNRWKTLISKLMSEELIKIELPERVNIHKIHKYGPDDKAEAWGLPSNSTIYMLSCVGDIRTVVTVFSRDEAYRS